jgi:hypothetical protein
VVTGVTTEEGTFEAVISTASVDREGDVVLPSAMVKALRSWTATSKLIPLSWAHSTEADDIVGHVDPESVELAGDEVVASGWVDRDTPRGRSTWRLMKSGTLGFSFGYLALDTVKRADGVREIRELDVFEVSATPTPMNAETRVVSTKSIGEYDRDREEGKQWMLEVLSGVPASKSLDRASPTQPAERERSPVQITTFEID